jgi:lipopolysaccharide/colanic/teichoic acid biosynthesis glycosyltransferase
MIKRLLDLLLSTIALLLLSPFLVITGIIIGVTSPGGIFFSQVRVGKDMRHFKLYKFRTMRPDAEFSGQLTVGMRDPRITGIGYFLRKYKLDELPQLLNIIKGDMSIVGPRPEVPKYVAMYDAVQQKVLSVKPGLTDYASLQYINENEILGKASDPEKTYIEEVMPAKLLLNLKYIQDKSLMTDLQIIFSTIGSILS